MASIAAGLCYVAMDPVPLRRERDSLEGNAIRGIVTDISEGVAYLVKTPWLWATLLYSTVLVLATLGPIEVLIPFVLRERVGVTPPITRSSSPPTESGRRSPRWPSRRSPCPAAT